MAQGPMAGPMALCPNTLEFCSKILEFAPKTLGFGYIYPLTLARNPATVPNARNLSKQKNNSTRMLNWSHTFKHIFIKKRSLLASFFRETVVCFCVLLGTGAAILGVCFVVFKGFEASRGTILEAFSSL